MGRFRVLGYGHFWRPDIITPWKHYKYRDRPRRPDRGPNQRQEQPPSTTVQTQPSAVDCNLMQPTLAYRQPTKKYLVAGPATSLLVPGSNRAESPCPALSRLYSSLCALCTRETPAAALYKSNKLAANLFNIMYRNVKFYVFLKRYLQEIWKFDPLPRCRHSREKYLRPSVLPRPKWRRLSGCHQDTLQQPCLTLLYEKIRLI